ncbi:MAG: ATP-binding protein [Actinobacteria bacterium]|nr:MAG: ATP-binding protein [Actinomycetota bacterium]
MATKKNEIAIKTEVRIAVIRVASDIVFESAMSAIDIKSAVTEALASSKPLILTDVRGHEIIVPADKIGFVEVGESGSRRVGFGAA